MKPEDALKKLQGIVRANAGKEDRPAMSRRFPDDLARSDGEMLFLGPTERDAYERTVDALSRDTRFEYLGADAEDAAWRFVCLAFLARKTDHVSDFLKRHAKVPSETACYFAIENLVIDIPRELIGFRFLPVDDEEVPSGPVWFDLSQPVGSVMMVPVSGTSYKGMRDRAAAAADEALGRLRIALRAHRVVPGETLRFRRGMGYSFGENLAGSQMHEDTAWRLDLDDELAELVSHQRIAALGVEGCTKLERKARLAAKWLARGIVAPDPLDTLLFSFTALEALLGDKAEGTKARGLAYRRAMLAVATGNSFRDPGRVYDLYEDVRSYAVHGEETRDVTRREANAFVDDVRAAIDQYLQLAQEHGLTQRGKLLTHLDSHADSVRLIEWLQSEGDPKWDQLSKISDDLTPKSLDE